MLLMDLFVDPQGIEGLSQRERRLPGQHKLAPLSGQLPLWALLSNKNFLVLEQKTLTHEQKTQGKHSTERFAGDERRGATAPVSWLSVRSNGLRSLEYTEYMGFCRPESHLLHSRRTRTAIPREPLARSGRGGLLRTDRACSHYS